MSKKKTQELPIYTDKEVPAIPPDDYKGTQAAWMIELQQRGLWNGEGWHGNVIISVDDWWDILETCEGTKL